MAPLSLSIKLLGGFIIHLGDQEIHSDQFRLRKARHIINILALSPGQRMHRDQLLELLWPDEDPHKASVNLYHTLYIARQVLEPAKIGRARFLQFRDEILYLYPDEHCSVDVETFEAAAREARQSRDPARYQACLDIFTGELLPEDRYEQWVIERRNFIQHEYHRLLAELATLYEAESDYPSAIAVLHKLLEDDRADEEAHRSLMRLLALSGKRDQALRQYNALRLALEQELEAEPDPQSAQLYQDILSGKFQPLDIAGGRKPLHNLPHRLSSFIGREEQIRQVLGLLEDGRLVTLVGPGGIGKTSLAIQSARERIADFDDGVWLVNLAPVGDPELVLRNTASIFGVREGKNRDLILDLVDFLGNRRLLLVLDNCEHLIKACAELAESLLQGCSSLKILATSRAPLNLAGEMTYPVPPLTLPDPLRPHPLPALAQYEAVRLFIERATAVQPSFSVTNANAPAVAQICTHLDGIPLAIELAATRTRHLSPDQIAARLGDRFNLLTGGARTALPRQQTLRATVDWSYDLLSEAERTLFNRLAVFAGSASLEAVEAISRDEHGFEDRRPALHPSQALDLLGALVDHSLVGVQEKNAETRYVLLETMRQYALEKLQASGELPDMQNRHLAYYLQLAQQGEAGTLSGSPAWMARFEIEYDNFRVAMQHALEGDPESAILLLSSLVMFNDLTARNREAYGWAIQILALTAGWPVGPLRAMALWLAGMSHSEFGEYQQAKEHLEASLEMAKNIGDKPLMNKIFHDLGSMYWQKQDWIGFHDSSEQHLSLSLELDDPWEIGCSLQGLGQSLIYLGDHPKASRYLEESLAINRREDFPMPASFSLAYLARLAQLEGDNARAIELYMECAQIRRQIGFRFGLATTLNNLGQVYLQEGDSVQVKLLTEESLEIFKEPNLEGGLVYCLAGFAGAAGNAGQDERAARWFGATGAAAEKLDLKMGDFERQIYDLIIAAVRGRLAEADFNAAWAGGRKLTLDEAILEACRPVEQVQG